MDEGKKRIGRPRKPPKPGTRVSLGLKVTPEIKNKLDEVAQASGRTQSQEAELRIERSFEHEGLLGEALSLSYGPNLAGVLQLIADVMHHAGVGGAFVKAGGSVADAQNWLEVPYAYDQAFKGAAKVLEAFRPEGDASPPADERLLNPNLGAALADAFISEAASGQARIENRKGRAKTIHELLGRALASRLKQSLRRSETK
jgi:hypothetical protein